MSLKRVFSKRNRALLHELVKTDFKLRYQGSAIGYLWSLFRPLFMFAILYVVFTVVFPLGMYAVAGIYLGRADSLPLVEAVGRTELWVALAAWSLVALAMVVHVVRTVVTAKGDSGRAG